MPHPILASSSKTRLQKLQGVGGLTFFKDYQSFASSLDADYALGSKIATYSCARAADAPATYVDSNGIIQLLTTADVRRRQGGYYDETGFHAQKGLMIEAAGTNLFVNGAFDENSAWDGADLEYSGTKRYSMAYSNSGAATLSMSDDSPYNGGKSAQIKITNDGTGSSTNDVRISSQNSLSLANATTYTLSFFIKTSSSCTFDVDIIEGNDDFTLYNALPDFTTVAGTWIRYSQAFTGLTGGLDVTDAFVKLKIGNNGNVTVNLQGFQIEASPYATSFIPTTTAALTRPAEVLKYAILNNRTAASESIFVKFAPEWDYTTTEGPRLIDTDTKSRQILFDPAVDDFSLYANTNDSSSASVNTSGMNHSKNTSYVVAGVIQHASPRTTIYYNGGNAQQDTDDFTDPVWGTYFHIGERASTGLNQLNGIIQAVAIYNRALSAAEVLAVTNILNQGGL